MYTIFFSGYYSKNVYNSIERTRLLIGVSCWQAETGDNLGEEGVGGQELEASGEEANAEANAIEVSN